MEERRRSIPRYGGAGQLDRHRLAVHSARIGLDRGARSPRLEKTFSSVAPAGVPGAG
jgi:hypothetical protein